MVKALEAARGIIPWKMAAEAWSVVELALRRSAAGQERRAVRLDRFAFRLPRLSLLPPGEGELQISHLSKDRVAVDSMSGSGHV
jgi:hypothetical protein